MYPNRHSYSTQLHSSSSIRSSSSFSNSSYSYSQNALFISSHSFLLPPNSSDGSSREMNLGDDDSLQHIQTTTTTINSSYSYSSSSNELLNSSNSFLPPPKISESSSRNSNSKNATNSIRQPQSNPLERFLHCSEENCPKELSGKKRTKWLKAGERARKNKSLLDSAEAFYWPQSNYDSPIHAHYKTSPHVIESLMGKLIC